MTSESAAPARIWQSGPTKAVDYAYLFRRDVIKRLILDNLDH